MESKNNNWGGMIIALLIGLAAGYLIWGMERVNVADQTGAARVSEVSNNVGTYQNSSMLDWARKSQPNTIIDSLSSKILQIVSLSTSNSSKVASTQSIRQALDDGGILTGTDLIFASCEGGNLLTMIIGNSYYYWDPALGQNGSWVYGGLSSLLTGYSGWASCLKLTVW